MRAAPWTSLEQAVNHNLADVRPQLDPCNPGTYFGLSNMLDFDSSGSLLGTHLPFPVRRGKVRDVYDLGDTLAIISTDRINRV